MLIIVILGVKKGGAQDIHMQCGQEIGQWVNTDTSYKLISIQQCIA